MPDRSPEGRLAESLAPADETVRRVIRHALASEPRVRRWRRPRVAVAAALVVAFAYGWWSSISRAPEQLSITLAGEADTLTATSSQGQHWIFRFERTPDSTRQRLLIAVREEP
jgi:hypothetical protein